MNETTDVSYSLCDHPLVVKNQSDVQWDDESDVIVVGFGGAGVVAALQAREDGAEVLAIDRFRGGGATAYSGGVIYAGGTPYQAKSGFNDTPEEMYKYLSAEGVPVKTETLRRYCEESNANLEWLARKGIPYGGNAYLHKTAFPPDSHWLYFSGNEKLPAFKDKAKPAPRGHRVVTPGFGGDLYYSKLRESALDKGVRFLAHAPVIRLVVDVAGRVIGIEVKALPQSLWKKHDKLYSVVSPWKPFNGKKSERAIRKCQELEVKVENTRLIHARAGVILTTGGYIYNLEMLNRYRQLLAKNYEGLLRLGSMGCDGSGMVLGQSVGGATSLMERIYLGRPIAPPEAFLYGVIVNVNGERFINEDAYQSKFGEKLVDQPEEGRAWLILNAKSFWDGVKQSLFPGKGMFVMWGAPALLNITFGGTKRGKDLVSLANKCRIDPEGLERTISNFNKNVRENKPDVLGKSSDKMVELEGPWYALNASLNNQAGPSFAFTLGGLVVNEETGEVLNNKGDVIEGLYAGGRAAVGLCSREYMSGLAIADTVFSGRRAGRHAAGKLAKAAVVSEPS